MITGAAGLLGQYVTRQLLDFGDQVLAVDNLSRYRLFGESRPQAIPGVLYRDGCQLVQASFFDPEVLAMLGEVDAVVHAAAQTSHPRSIDEPWQDFEVNAVGTMRLLEAMRALVRNAPRFVFVSSAKIYGENVCPSTVECKTRLSPAVSGEALDWFSSVNGHLAVNERCPIGNRTIMTPFGVSKAAADLYCQEYAKLYYGLDIVILRPGCFTGPCSLAVEQQNWLPMLVRAAVRGETFTVFGFGGKQVRDVLHVDDLARAVVACLDREPLYIYDETYDETNAVPIPWEGDVFNVGGGTGNDLSILEAVDLVYELTGKRCEIRHAEKRPGDWPWAVFSNAKIKGVLGWEPRIGIRDLVKELCEEATLAE